MGTICSSRDYRTRVIQTAEELDCLKRNIATCKEVAEVYQSQLKQTQEEVQALTTGQDTVTEPYSDECGIIPYENTETDRLRILLKLDLEEGLSLFLSLQKTLNRAISSPPTPEETRLEDLEQVETILVQRHLRVKELLSKLSSDRESLKKIINDSWDWLKTRLHTLGKTEALSELPEIQQFDLVGSLKVLLKLYKVLSDEYVRLSVASTPCSAIESSNLQLNVDSAKSHQIRLETLLSQLEAANNNIRNETTSLKASTTSLQSDVRVRSQLNQDLEGKNKDMEEQVIALEDDLNMKKALAIHVKEELAEAQRKNEMLKQEVEKLKLLQSQDLLAAEMIMLEQEHKQVAAQVEQVKEDLTTKQELILTHQRKIVRLEETLKEGEEKATGSTGDIDARMRDVQTTLQTLYTSIEDNGTEDLLE